MNQKFSLEQLLERYADLEGFTLLNGSWSGGSTDEHSYAFLDPVYKIEITDTGSSVFSSSGQIYHSRDAFAALRDFLFPILNDLPKKTVPFVSGFLSYELLHLIERVPEVKSKLHDLPLARFYLYSRVLEITPQHCAEHTLGLSCESGSLWDSVIASPIGSSVIASPQGEAMRYQDGVREILDQIGKGNVYQVNLTRSFQAACTLTPQALFKQVIEATLPTLGAFLRTSPSHSVICASPELFINSDGEKLLTSPIKGTAARGASEQQDREIRSSLQNSEKDLAELSMIVDLLRNDLGRVAAIGSVRVKNHARIDTLPYLHHLVSDIEATLAPQYDLVDVIRALFPCGSITGAPKIAAMKLIAALERQTRGIYCGSIGWIRSPREFKFNVAIRTGILTDQTLTFHSGAGIVWDSDPQAEELETNTKAKFFLSALA